MVADDKPRKTLNTTQIVDLGYVCDIYITGW